MFITGTRGFNRLGLSGQESRYQVCKISLQTSSARKILTGHSRSLQHCSELVGISATVNIFHINVRVLLTMNATMWLRKLYWSTGTWTYVALDATARRAPEKFLASSPQLFSCRGARGRVPVPVPGTEFFFCYRYHHSCRWRGKNWLAHMNHAFRLISRDGYS